MVADDDLWKLHNYKAKIYIVEEEIWGKHGSAFCPHTRYNTRHARRRGAMPICWCLSSGWLDVGPAMGAHEQRVHFIKWFIQDMIINGGTLLSRQESIDARSRHSRSPGLADRERRRSKTNEEQSRHDRVRVFVCLYLWESEGERMYDEWWRERQRVAEGRYAFSPIPPYIYVFFPLSYRCALFLSTLRCDPRHASSSTKSWKQNRNKPK